MLMVLMALLAAMTLAMAYLASQDNSWSVGENVADAAAGRTLAGSGLELGVAILETESDWRNGHQDGWLLMNHPLLGGMIDLHLEDLATSGPPNDATEMIRLTVTARQDGVVQEASAIAYVPLSCEPPDPDVLDEFALFTVDEFRLSDHALLGRWSRSPLAMLGRRVAVGTQATAPMRVRIRDNAVAIDTTIYHGPDASSTLVSNAGLLPVVVVELPGTVPMPEPDLPLVDLPGDDDDQDDTHGSDDKDLDDDDDHRKQAHGNERSATHADRTTRDSAPVAWRLGGNGDAVIDELLVDSLLVNEHATLGLAPGGLIVSLGDLVISEGGRVAAEGNATIVVFGSLQIDNGSLTVPAGSNLVVYVGADLLLRNAYVGDAEGLGEFDPDLATWSSPGDIRVLGIAAFPTAWELRDRTLVKACLWSPHSTFQMRDDAVLCGRVATSTADLRDASALLYDHVLHRSDGWTNPDSDLWNDRDNFRDADATAWGVDAESFGLADHALRDSTSPMKRFDPSTNRYDTGATRTTANWNGSPTPRTIDVDYRWVALGRDIHGWEDHHENGHDDHEEDEP